MARMIDAWKQLFTGLGKIQLDGGNLANAPAPAPVQAGNSYEWVQPYYFPSQHVVQVQSIPPSYRDWNELGVNLFGVSGLTGGGAQNGSLTNVNESASLYFDTQIGAYVDLNAVFPGS